MKKLLKVIGITIALLPCLLILNESDSFWPNLIGMFYLIGIVYVTNK